MNWLEATILGLIQGLTEFLPVSSSGHLTIGQQLLGLNTSAADNLLFDIVVHAATVLSTIVILWNEISQLFVGTFTTTKWNYEKEYVAKIFLSMIPVFVVGMFFKDEVENLFGSGLLLVGICLTITALLLAFAYYAKPRIKKNITWLDAFVIGIGQAVAVLPGLSRSGTTIATGLLLGDRKEQVAQFSFIMVLIPVLGQALLSALDIVKDSTAIAGIGVAPIVAGFIAAFIAGSFACKFMIELVKRGKLIWFAWYCLIIGLIVIISSLFK
ncbi:MAG: undecaprenyl-diphosphate phosphatase [Paludibacteraceae bacterium]|nr:undecaprenyl-diphosphate phosphatase [Paludibacteraceae bacterium]